MIIFRIFLLILLANLPVYVWAAEDLPPDEKKPPKAKKEISPANAEKAAAGKKAYLERKAAAEAKKAAMINQEEKKPLSNDIVQDEEYTKDINDVKAFEKDIDFAGKDFRLIKFTEEGFLDSINGLRKRIALAMFYRNDYDMPTLLLGVASDNCRFEVALRTSDLYVAWAKLNPGEKPLTYFFLKDFYAKDTGNIHGKPASEVADPPSLNAFEVPLDEEEEEEQKQLLAEKPKPGIVINVEGEPEYDTFPKPLLVDHFEKLDLFDGEEMSLRKFNFHLAVLISESLRLKPVAQIVHKKILNEKGSFHLVNDKNFPVFLSEVANEVKDILVKAEKSKKMNNSGKIESVYNLVTNWKSTTELRISQLTRKDPKSEGIEKVLGVPHTDLYKWLDQISKAERLKQLKYELDFLLLGKAKPELKAKPDAKKEEKGVGE